MATECIPDQRDRLRAVGERLSALPSVWDIQRHVDHETHGVCLEVTFAADGVGVPSRACQLLGEGGAGVGDLARQGPNPIAWVVLDR